MTLQKRRDMVVITDEGQTFPDCLPSQSPTHPSTPLSTPHEDESTRMIITEEGQPIDVPKGYRNNGLRGSTQSNHSPLPVKSPVKSSEEYSPSQISQSSSYPVGTKKHIWLPPRSLLLLSGESRYLW